MLFSEAATSWSLEASQATQLIFKRLTFIGVVINVGFLPILCEDLPYEYYVEQGMEEKGPKYLLRSTRIE
jgi:hypothetical protein